MERKNGTTSNDLDRSIAEERETTDESE